ncbi:MAG: hypothetical protein HZA48_13190 [Planctomycetes bacterium]|nr:hypothetical protein [Planctomycetota bacterium]
MKRVTVAIILSSLFLLSSCRIVLVGFEDGQVKKQPKKQAPVFAQLQANPEPQPKQPAPKQPAIVQVPAPQQPAVQPPAPKQPEPHVAAPKNPEVKRPEPRERQPVRQPEPQPQRPQPQPARQPEPVRTPAAPELAGIYVTSDSSQKSGAPADNAKLNANESVTVYAFGKTSDGKWMKLPEGTSIKWEVDRGLEVTPNSGPAVTIKATQQITNPLRATATAVNSKGDKVQASFTIKPKKSR